MSFISIIVPIFHGKQYMKDVVNQIEECKRKLSKEDRKFLGAYTQKKIQEMLDKNKDLL